DGATTDVQSSVSGCSPRGLFDLLPDTRRQAMPSCDQLTERLVLRTHVLRIPGRQGMTRLWAMCCVNKGKGAIPAGRSAPAWQAGIFSLLKRRAAELRRVPPPWRFALRGDRPKQLKKGFCDSMRFCTFVAFGP